RNVPAGRVAVASRISRRPRGWPGPGGHCRRTGCATGRGRGVWRREVARAPWLGTLCRVRREWWPCTHRSRIQRARCGCAHVAVEGLVEPGRRGRGFGRGWPTSISRDGCPADEDIACHVSAG